MAIAFVAAGTRTKADVSVSGTPVAVALPAGHLSTHWLLMIVVTDDNTGPSTPSGWSLLGSFNPGASASSPYTGRPHLTLFHRIDNGSLGSSVNVTFNTAAWPAGDPYVLAWTEAYSGVDNAGPVELISGDSTVSTASAHAHPILTTAVTNDFLLSVRAIVGDAASTFGIAGGTNTERVDDSHGSPASPSAAAYDAGPLAAGAQTQRTTTASGSATYGSVAVSIALKPAAVAGTAFANPTAATGTATAYNATVLTQSNPWDLCGPDQIPEYSFMVDWDGLPVPLNDNWNFETTGAGWTAFGGAVYARSSERAFEGMWSGKITTTGAASPRIESDKAPVSPDHRYKASGRIFTDTALPSGVSFSVNWYTAGDVYISTSSSIFTPLVGDWLYADGFFVAPLTAAKGAILMDLQGTPGAGIQVWGDLIRLDDDEETDHFNGINPEEDVTGDIITETSITYGRDQDRQLSPAAVGNASFSVNNSSRTYSPEYSSSPLAGNLDPAREMKAVVTFGGNEYGLFRGRIDDYNVKADFSDRTVDFSFLDGLSLLQGVKLSTGVYSSMRTGELIGTILDLAGWTGPRDLDPGATIVPNWWTEGNDALSAIQELVRSEGPPAVAYQAPDGTLVFRDRHHRLLRTESLDSQGTFSAAAVGCDSPAASGHSFTDPFLYAHGWRDIVNSVSFDVNERLADLTHSAVWTSDSTYSLSIGESVEVTVSGSDPFTDAVTPVAGTDFTTTGAGTVNVTLNRNSGVAVKITLLAVGGAVEITALQLRAKAITTRRTVKILRQDTASIGQHGERSYPEDAPWADAQDAAAIANMILLHYAQRRPTVQLRIVTSDPSHYIQVLQRTVSDRIHIVNGEMGLDDDFFVERVTHTISRMNAPGRPPVHSVVLGCEKQLETVANPFTFDKRGAGFDDGVFDPIQSDNASTVFIFDHPVQGQFDTGLFGT